MPARFLFYFINVYLFIYYENRIQLLVLCGKPKIGSVSVFKKPNRTEAKFQNRHVGFPKFPRVCPKPKERRR